MAARSAGRIGNGVGFDLYPLRRPTLRGSSRTSRSAAPAATKNLLLTQHFFALEGEARDLQPRLTPRRTRAGHGEAGEAGRQSADALSAVALRHLRWAMVIDTTACIGCNACVVACQAENNSPVVGPDEIAAGRDMHWLRIDDYIGRRSAPAFRRCRACIASTRRASRYVRSRASVHDSEGLNVQVYNRCIGTRFCEANCPYKVRRFNFFGYADGQEYAGLGADIVRRVFNPDVTVRGRGVMEKCTYCVQRISRARRAAEKEDRPIRDGEVVTACQSACPTRRSASATSTTEARGPRAAQRAAKLRPARRSRTRARARPISPPPQSQSGPCIGA